MSSVVATFSLRAKVRMAGIVLTLSLAVMIGLKADVRVVAIPLVALAGIGGWCFGSLAEVLRRGP